MSKVIDSPPFLKNQGPPLYDKQGDLSYAADTDAAWRHQLCSWLDFGTLICLVVLASLLPFADITTSRDVAIILGLLFWAVRMALLRKWEFVRTPLDIPLLFLVFTGIVSVFTAADPWYSLHELRGEMLKGIALFYLAVNNLRSESRAKAVFWALIAGAVVMDVYGVYHYLMESGQSVVQEGSLHRGSVELATYVIQVLPYIFLGVLWSPRFRLRAPLFLLLGLHLLVLHMTFSRAGWGSVVLMGLLILFILTPTRKSILIGLAALLMFSGFVFQSGFFLRGGYFTPGCSLPTWHPGPAERARLEVWSFSLDYIRQHPFEGIGFGRHSFLKKFPERKESPQTRGIWHTHNTFLNLTLQMGLQGLAVFLFVLYRIFRTLWPGVGHGLTWLRSGFSRVMVIGAFTMTVGYCFRNITDDIFNNDAALLFWLLVGCAFSLKRFVPQSD